MRVSPVLRPLLIGLACAFASACATSPHATVAKRHDTLGANHSARHNMQAAQAALDMLGTPYEWGGSSPRGFDCSGLVVYSYRAAGIDGLPHSVAQLFEVSSPLGLSEAEAGDLLFFQLTGKKTSHVGIYVGQRQFVHAPSSGKTVEKVSFDHVYWGPQLERASVGRIHR